MSTLPNVSPPRDRSAPEQNAGGVPVSTTARMSSSVVAPAERVVELGPHRAAEGVAHVGSVERDRGDLVAHVEADVLVFAHAACTVSTSAARSAGGIS